MRRLVAGALAVMGTLALGAGVAEGKTIPVGNASFELTPSGGLSNLCPVNYPGCAYSVGPIPDWSSSGSTVTGQFQPGQNKYFFSYIPDGVRAAYTNGAALLQTVGETAVPGVTYTLKVDVGSRKDCCAFAPRINLIVGDNAATATFVGNKGGGQWVTGTASYTATAEDAGKPITISLSAKAPQANFDNIRLTSSSLPEPTAWGMMLIGFGALGLALRAARRARRTRVPTT